MSIVVLRKPEMILTGTTEQVVIGDSARVIDSLMRDSDGVVEDVTGWTASIIGHSPDLPGVYFDVPGEIVAPASAGVFRWTHVGDFLTQIGEKSRARFTCQVRSVNADGLVGYGAEFGLDFVVPETGEDTNMNAASVETLIQNALISGDYRFFSHWHAIPTSGFFPRGQRSAGFVDKFIGTARYISTPVGSNKVFEVVEDFLIYPAKAPGPHAYGWNSPIIFTMVLNSMSGNAAAPAGECLQGIEIGSFGQLTPWATNYAFGNGPVLQLRYNFTLTRWEVLVWELDTETPPDVVPCSVQPPFVIDNGIVELMMVYEPNLAGDTSLRCYIDRVLVHTYTGGRLNVVPVSGTSEPRGCGYFMTNGTGAAQSWTEGGFYFGRVYEPMNFTAMPG